MKLKVTVIEEMEVEINFPAFYRHGSGFYKIIDENTWIRTGVCESLGEKSLIIVFNEKPAYADNVLSKGERITEEEFQTEFESALAEMQAYSKVTA